MKIPDDALLMGDMYVMREKGTDALLFKDLKTGENLCWINFLGACALKKYLNNMIKED